MYSDDILDELIHVLNHHKDQIFTYPCLVWIEDHLDIVEAPEALLRYPTLFTLDPLSLQTGLDHNEFVFIQQAVLEFLEIES